MLVAFVELPPNNIKIIKMTHKILNHYRWIFLVMSWHLVGNIYKSVLIEYLNENTWPTATATNIPGKCSPGTRGLFTKEVYLRLAKRPLVFNGCLANHRLTSLVKEATAWVFFASHGTETLSIGHQCIPLTNACFVDRWCFFIVNWTSC